MWVIGACGGPESTKTARLYLDPESIDFLEGNDVNGVYTESINVENRGSIALNLRDFRLENTSGRGMLSAVFSGDFGSIELNTETAVTTETITLEADATARVSVRYVGDFQTGGIGRLTLSSNDPDRLNVAIPIGAGAGGPEIRVSPVTLNFGTVEIGGRGVEELRVTNTGLRTLNIAQMSIEGSADYQVEAIVLEQSDENIYVAADGSTIPEFAIERGESALVSVAFAPQTTLTNVTSDLVITSNADNTPITRVSLLANGARACLIASPEFIDFGSALKLESTEGETPNERLLLLESCGSSDLRIDRIELERGNEAFKVLELPEVGEGDPLFRLPALVPGEVAPNRELKLGFWPTELTSYGDRLLVHSNDPDSPQAIDLFGRGTDNQCPVAIPNETNFNATPLDILTLDGSSSLDQGGEVVKWEWVVIDSPEGSVSAPVESYADPARPADGGIADDDTTPTAFFFVDIAGRYTLELRVIDNLGQPNCTPATVTVEALPSKSLHIELIWSTPDDPDETDAIGTDMDLHLRHELGGNGNEFNWANAAGPNGIYDCNFRNKTPNWGTPGLEDNPSLDIDDTNGAGPENITMAGPEIGVSYDIGVNYFRAKSTLGLPDGNNLVDRNSFATVRVYVLGNLLVEFQKELFEERALWHVARLNWCDEADVTRCPEVEIVDRIYSPSEWFGSL